MKKILFYPGTFNPPHLGHASAVLVALKNLAFDEVWIFPSGKRVDRDIPTSLEDRRSLSALFVDYLRTQTPIPVRLVADALDSAGGKYTHEIIVELKSHSEDEIYQLCGTDGFTSIKERVVGPNEKFVVIKRSGYKFPGKLNSNTNLIILDEVVEEISSTEIREMIKNGDQGYEKLVPEKIASYIEEHGLYL